jgi:Kef-type K+ transport system membrane component KefB
VNETSVAAAFPLPVILLLIFGAAKLLAEVFERLRQPAILGEILAGVLLGPAVLHWVQPNELLGALSELGVMFLLFRVGLEVKSSELLRVGGIATLVAACGVIVPFAAAWAIARTWGLGQTESMFVGAVFVATSVGITAQVLSARGLLQEVSSKIILAAAVIDDVLGLIVLAIVSGLAKGKMEWSSILLAAALPVIFTVIVALWGSHSVRRVAPHIEARLQATDAQFHLSLVLLFALSAAALYVGVAAIVGAFLAGMALGEHVDQRVNDLVHGSAELFVPFFLAGIGLHVDIAAFKDPNMLMLGAALILAGIATKVIGCGAGALSLGAKTALRIGVGMIPRGEVGMVVAGLGLTLGVVSHQIYGVVVFAALATTVVTPPLLALVYRDEAAPLALGANEVADP